MTANYDTNAPKSTLSALFDSHSDATNAIDRLKAAGITQVRLLPGHEADENASTAAPESGFWGRLEDWFFPDDDRATYAEGLRRGGFLVSVEVDGGNYDVAHDILDDEGTIDLDERADLWRTEGWDADRSISEFRQVKKDPASTIVEADRAQQAAGATDDVFAADPSGTDAGGRSYTRTTETRSGRVRSYDIDNQELPDDPYLKDDILPTGHQLSVDEANERAKRQMSQSQDLDGLRQDQILNRDR